MKKQFRTLLATAAIVLASNTAFANEYAVIVNAANNFAGDTKAEVKNLFLKRKTAWSDGTRSVPLARGDDSPEQQAFNSLILDMSEAEVAGHWQAEKQKTGETPPKAVGSERILYRQIKRKEGAFGVVLNSSATALPEGIKVLFKF